MENHALARAQSKQSPALGPVLGPVLGSVLGSARRSLLKVRLSVETDFVLARQRAKQIAGLLGFELQDQTRIATAVSEIARNAWEYANGGSVEFLLDCPGPEAGTRLCIVVSDRGAGIPHLDAIWEGTYRSPTGMGLGMIGARRLMDDFAVATGAGGTQVTLIKAIPKHAPPLPTISDLGAALARVAVGSPAVGAIAAQNQELLGLLGDLRAREAELRVLNMELEETNRGVMVLYAELEDKAKAVQEASEMKTRFLSGVTHELRTPLNSIVSLSRLMLGHSDGPLNPEQEKQVTFILRSAQNLTEMVNDLLDLAKIEAGKSSVHISTFTVQTLFAGLRGMFRPLATNPNVKLSFEFPERPLELATDEGKLSQILRNFIANALKFTEAGSVTVSAELIPASGSRGLAQVRFSVADTGVGIAPEHHELVMQEWGQAPIQPGTKSNLTSHCAKGSGLGLPLSRSLAELLDGAIGFTSEPGAGSTFYVTLPAIAPEAVPETVPKGPVPTEGSERILIVDDDEVARYLLRRQLATLTSAAIEEATNGVDALLAIARNAPRLVFLDMVMPGMDGAEVARQLRSRPETAELRVVLHTSMVLSQAERSALKYLDLTIIGKRPVGGQTTEWEELQRVEMERALLEVGLSNLHVEGDSAP
jgi:signal transduction histidine kinase/CheY-like chemotaxis protein